MLSETLVDRLLQQSGTFAAHERSRPGLALAGVQTKTRSIAPSGRSAMSATVRSNAQSASAIASAMPSGPAYRFRIADSRVALTCPSTMGAITRPVSRPASISNSTAAGAAPATAQFASRDAPPTAARFAEILTDGTITLGNFTSFYIYLVMLAGPLRVRRRRTCSPSAG